MTPATATGTRRPTTASPACRSAWGLRVLDRLDLAGDETVLDAGCGSGRMTRHVLERVPDGQRDRGRRLALDDRARARGARRRRAARAESPTSPSSSSTSRSTRLLQRRPSTGSPTTSASSRGSSRRFAPAARLEAQFGGEGNVAEFRTRSTRSPRTSASPTTSSDLEPPWNFAGAEETEARLLATPASTSRRSGWTTYDEQPDDPDEFMRASGLNAHLERLPEDLRERSWNGCATRCPSRSLATSASTAQPGGRMHEEYGDAYPVEVQWRRPRRVTAADLRPRIAVLPGDGIGPEIMRPRRAACSMPLGDFELTEHPVGGVSIDEHGTALTDEVLEACRASDAVLLGAVGGPKWDTTDPDAPRPEQGLLGLRKGLGLYANLRPVQPSPVARAREPAAPRPHRRHRPARRARADRRHLLRREGARATTAPSTPATTRSPRSSASRESRSSSAPARGGDGARVSPRSTRQTCSRPRGCGARPSRASRAEFADVELDHLLVDNAAMQLVSDPSRFDVILTENMFGDILSDESAMLTGSLGMLPSASLGADGPGMYEPVHGSAPDIAGKGIANPLATFLSVAMMLRYGLDRPEDADRIEAAVESGARARPAHPRPRLGRERGPADVGHPGRGRGRHRGDDRGGASRSSSGLGGESALRDRA